MSYIVDDGNTECTKLRKKFTDFHTCTKVFVRAIRKIHHGIKEEHNKITTYKLKDAISQKIFDRHERAFNKLSVGLEDYFENLLTMKNFYEDYISTNSKYLMHLQSKVEKSYRCLTVQRDLIFLGISNIITLQVHYACEHFKHDDSTLRGDTIFKVIEIYNKYLLKVKRIPTIVPYEASTNAASTSRILNPSTNIVSLQIDNPLQEKVPCPFHDSISTQCLPDCVLPISSKLKKLTASKILNIAATSRSIHVTKCVSSLLVSNVKYPQEENGARLPWKPIIYDITGALPQVDIFEEAIAIEEDEYKRNQRKLDIALKQEFGDDFPETEYCPGKELIANLPPLNNEEINLFDQTNVKLFEIFATKFLITFGVLVGTMMKLNKNGKWKILRTAKARLEGYFIEQMWGVGTEQIEEIVIWAPPAQRPPLYPPPAIMKQLDLFKFLNNFNQYCDRGVLPESCEASCESLVDDCRHIAIMSFMDIALVRGFGPYSRTNPGYNQLSDGNYCTEGGHHIVDAVEMLVWQINEIEKVEPEREGKEWPLAELVGFILCLGGLLGSILSSSRLRASYLLHSWSTAPFFLVTQADLPRIIEKLKRLRIEERDNLVKTDDMTRLQLVMYREKVVKMIETMVRSIKAYEQETVDDVSCVCRTVSLAQLQNSMPIPKVWRGIGRIPHEPQEYVYEYIGTVLEPVLEAVTRLGVILQKRAGSTVLKVVCYAWLEHIKVQKIKFSLWGAQQLLKDFHALAEWLRNYPGLDPEARTQILAVDVLRECEGVARLLMRQPPLVVGYTSHNQVAPTGPISAGRKHDKEVRLSCEDDGIPPEMYVPNQQLWLGLRARSASAICVRLATCCSWPY